MSLIWWVNDAALWSHELGEFHPGEIYLKGRRHETKPIAFTHRFRKL
jgi:hypothetical protein